MALLAEVVLRQLEPGTRARPTSTARACPGRCACRVLAQDARDHFRAGDIARAAGLAADVVVLADSCRPGSRRRRRRLTLAEALLAQDEPDQAATTFLYALEQAAAMPMPLRGADAFDGAGAPSRSAGQAAGPQLAATARALRAPRHAVRLGVRRADTPSSRPRRSPTAG